MSLYTRFGKRAVDVVASATVLIALSPVLLAAAFAIRLEDGGPILFVSERVGRGGRTFPFYKFRSMPVNTAHVPSAEAGSLRVTRIGRVLRRTNLDELPQLVNILRGEMSLVGPRPAIPRQAELQNLRRASGALDCTPGLTGLAQVSAYDGMPETEKARYDAEYARSVTFRQDALVVLRTLGYLAKPPPAY